MYVVCASVRMRRTLCATYLTHPPDPDCALFTGFCFFFSPLVLSRRLFHHAVLLSSFPKL